MDQVAILFVRHRLLLAFFVLSYTGVCFYGIGRVRFVSDLMEFFKSDEMEYQWLEGDFSPLERTALIAVEGDKLLTSPGLDVMSRITQGAGRIEGVEAVYSMLNLRGNRRIGRYLLPLLPAADASLVRIERAREQADSHPLLVGHLLSHDKQTALVIVQFDARVQGVSQSKRVLSRMQQMLADQTQASDFRARITGAAALQLEIVENMRQDISRLTLLGVALVVVIATLLFRRIAATLLVTSGPAVGAIWTVGTLGLIGQPINMLTNVVPLLVLVIGFTDAMHLGLHVRRAVAGGASSLEAAESSIGRLGLACALTSLSTAVGFASLSVANLEIIRTFGWCCALGSVLSFVAVITVVPLVASTPLGRNVVAAAAPQRSWGLGPLADGILAQLLRHPRFVLVWGTAVTIVLGTLVTRLEPDHTVANEIPHSCKAYQTLAHLDEKFGGMMFAYAVVQWPDGAGLRSNEIYEVLKEVHQAVGTDSVLSNPLSILNLVESLPGEEQSLPRRARQLRYVPREMVDRMVSVARRRAIISVHVPDVGTRILKPTFAEVKRQFDQIERRHPGFDVQWAGATVAVFESVHLMIEDLWKSLATAAGVMFLMIWVGLRSLRYALVSLMPNIFPLLCAGAFIVLSGRYLEMSSVIVFSISLGIAVDDTIHFLVCFKREMESGAEPRAAVRRTFDVVGTALLMTTVALVAGHGIVMLSAFPAIRIYGMMASVTIASALVGDLLILPAILVSLGWSRDSSAVT